MNDTRRVCDLTTGDLLLAALTEFEREKGFDVGAGNWQLVAHLRDRHIRKLELHEVTSSVRIAAGARELFDRGELGSAA